ncbi:putative oxidoreductase [Serratia liquefaciens]|jgi:aryl-alcohol dehydrogenase-like predicted oxidoreductase|uniref:aldo/keto reductase n=1 Tax=Serratia liquefaciens TaxID=614 RepID=UPI002178A5F2|nr:aldo/keto reductase [Serratia liquefaciens]CAI0914242.1 putative oxidoreductase [Serratia liquefaciens]CAI1775157.1 putative oxidoreductase [Serratia liquefaciens]CAI1833737.1 putative oxidoreductase [Serratia liquefaciens]HDS8359380.1 aldo/keto reductase [Serratia liquefaciens]
MQQRKLGPTGPLVSALGLGCMGMSDFYSTAHDEQEAIATLHRALELGVTLLDTADMYGPHTNEQLIGKAIKGKRQQVFLATKFGIVRDPANPAARGVSSRPEYIRQSVEGSLKRLEVEVIDLYYQHRVDPEVPIEEVVGTMADLISEGKIRYIGLSEASVATLERAHKVHPITALQTEYSLWTRDAEQGVLAACERLGIGFVPYSPLGRGFLTGAIQRPEDLDADDFRRSNPRFQGENFARNLALVEKVTELAKQKGVAPSQLALAWVLAQGEHIVPIPGTKRRRYLEENIAAAELTLSAAELAAIEAVFPLQAAAGARYGAESMTYING